MLIPKLQNVVVSHSFYINNMNKYLYDTIIKQEYKIIYVFYHDNYKKYIMR